MVQLIDLLIALVARAVHRRYCRPSERYSVSEWRLSSESAVSYPLISPNTYFI